MLTTPQYERLQEASAGLQLMFWLGGLFLQAGFSTGCGTWPHLGSFGGQGGKIGTQF